MRLIDADALKAYIDAQKGRPWIGCTIGEALKIMTDEQPTIEPQRTGKWIDSHGHTTIDGHDMSELFIRCSECGHDYPDLKGMRFCPNCGAKMEDTP